MCGGRAEDLGREAGMRRLSKGDKRREINLSSVRVSFEYLYGRGWATRPHGSCWAKKKFEKGQD
jgi:hypothetical protein